jgi:hypothetical protein
MVYEQLAVTTKHHTLDSIDAPDKSSTITLVSKELPVQILATCQFINTEAKKILLPRLRQLEKQPMRFLASAASAEALLRLDNPLTLCLGQQPRAQGSSLELSEAAKAFINRCNKTFVALRLESWSSGSRFDIEIMLTDGEGPSREESISLFAYSYLVFFQHNYGITLLRKEPAVGTCGANWQLMQRVAALSSADQRINLRLADGPDAEQWRKDWEETPRAPEARGV